MDVPFFCDFFPIADTQAPIIRVEALVTDCSETHIIRAVSERTTVEDQLSETQPHFGRSCGFFKR